MTGPGIASRWEAAAGVVDRWVETAASHIKLVDQALTGLQGSYVELLPLVAIGLLAALPVLVPERRRQLFRRLSQLLGILVFIFLVYTCMGVFGMVRNLFRGLTEIGRENILALYFCSVPVTILASSMIFGPMFCGWICPTGALQEFAAGFARGWHRRRHARGWRFSRGALALSLATLAVSAAWLWRLSRTRVFFVEDSSVYWAEVLLILQFALLWRKPEWDGRLRRLRLLSLGVIVLAAWAGWWITSPVHLVFTKVYDPASLLSTVVVVLAALVVPRAWCRYLCPWREAIGWAGRCSTRCLETRADLCTACGACETACDVDAVRKGVVDAHECHLCLRCVDACPAKAIRLTETWTSKAGGGV